MFVVRVELQRLAQILTHPVRHYRKLSSLFLIFQLNQRTILLLLCSVATLNILRSYRYMMSYLHDLFLVFGGFLDSSHCVYFLFCTER